MSEVLSIELLLISVFIGISISLLLIFRAFKTGFSFWIIRDIAIILMISILSISVGGGIVLNGLYKYITYPTYKAIIIDIDEQDSDSQSAATYKILVNNKEIISKSSTYTSTKKFVGEQVVVNYSDEDVRERSSGILVRYIFGAIFSIILFLILIGYIYSGLYSHINIIFRPKKLHKAAANDDAEQIKHYLLQGIDVNTLDKNGLTPLVIAIENNAYESVQLLLSNGADIRRIDEYGETVLHTACYASDIAMVKLLIGRGAKVNLRDNDGNTALHYACEDDDNLEIVKFLLQSRVEIDAQNNERETALHIATVGHCKKIISYLIDKNANAKLKNNKGLTAKEIADDELAELFMTPEEKEKFDKSTPRYIEILDRTNFSSNIYIFIGPFFMLLGGFAYFHDPHYLSLFIMIMFSGAGFIFFIKAVLNKISLSIFGEIPVYVDKHTTKVGSTLTGYIMSTQKLENIQIVFTLSHQQHTESTNMNSDTSHDTKVLWTDTATGELRFMESKKVIYFEILIKKGQKTKDNYSWKLSLKQKSNIFILQREYDIIIG